MNSVKSKTWREKRKEKRVFESMLNNDIGSPPFLFFPMNLYFSQIRISHSPLWISSLNLIFDFSSLLLCSLFFWSFIPFYCACLLLQFSFILTYLKLLDLLSALIFALFTVTLFSIMISFLFFSFLYFSLLILISAFVFADYSRSC